jgi:hypothetical protein
MKIFKKLLIIIPVTIFALFLILLLTPILFKGKLLEIAKKELNRNLTAKVDFSDLKLSFIRNFPDAYIALEDLTITGTLNEPAERIFQSTDEFEGETLVEFKSLSLRVDIMSVIRMKNIQVKSILLDQAKINAHISENGSANWNIMKPKEAAGSPPPPDKTAPEKDTSASALKIALNRFEIRDADISFRDDSRTMTASANGLNFFLHGDMTLDNVDLNMKLDIADVNFRMNGINLLTKARVGLVSEFAADLKNMAFTLKENRFNLNEIALKFAGSARIHDDINIDMTFAAEKTDFKSVLCLVPAIYMKKFETITTTGSFTLAGKIKGVYNDTQMPNADVNLTIDNAMFKYPDLPKSINNINIKARAAYDGAVFDRTTLDVDKLHFEMAGNPFDAELHVKTPESDMQVAAKFLGLIDFNSLSDIIPLDDITLRGLLECDLALAGRMSAIEKQQYEDFDAKGSLKLSGVDFKSSIFPQAVKIKNTRLNFTPRRVELVDFDAVIGNSDMSMNGVLENFIPFIFKGSTVRGDLNLKSNNIDLNEFMKPKESAEKPKQTAEKPEEGESALSVIEVPKNIEFAVKVSIAGLLFDKLRITDVAGAVSVKDGILRMQNLSMNTLEGSVALSGEYNTQNIKFPSVNFNADIKQVDVTSALSSFDILKKILPNPLNYVGKVSANLTLSGALDEHLSPVLNTVASKGQLQTHNVKIQNSQLFGAMANLLKNEAWRTPALDNINVKYEIKDGQLIIEPIRMNIAQTALEISGSQGLDMTLNYRVNAAVPVSSVGSAATDVLSKIPGASNIREIRVAGLIGGSVTQPVVTLDVADMAANVVETVKETVIEQAKEEFDKQISAIMAEAERQAQNVRNTAKQTADRLRKEADDNAAKLEAAATNPLAKIAAQAAAKKLRDEGSASADKIEQEAERQVAAIMDAAQKKADELRN